MGIFDKLNNQDADKLYSEAMTLIEKNQYEEAVTKLELAKKLDSNSPAIYYCIGVCYQKQSSFAAESKDKEVVLIKFKKSVEAFENALKLNEKKKELNDNQIFNACYVIGMFCLPLEKIDKSIDYLEKAVQIDPKHDLSKYHLAISYFYKGQLNKAEELVLQLLESGQINENVVNFWEEIQKKLGKGIVGNLSEEICKKIYYGYKKAVDDEFSEYTPNDFKPVPEWDVIGYALKSEEIFHQCEEKAQKKILKEYNIKPYQLILIRREGQRKKW